jgi:predicted nucleic acid-binding protein
MELYLDTNVYFRPFDDLTQTRIRNEASSFSEIVESASKGKCSLLKSDILILEVKRTEDLLKRKEVEQYLGLSKYQIELTKEIKELACRLETDCRLAGRDALHISFAAIGGATHFLTCDDSLLKRKKIRDVKHILKESGYKISILNPIEFLEILERE